LITVRAFKYDGSEHRTWSARVLQREGSLLVLEGTFDEEIRHDVIGTIRPGTLSLEYYWLDRWYNVFRFAQPGGALRNYYCNINSPPAFAGQTLSYVDLDIDILVEPDFSYRILDLDDFERNSSVYNYSAQTKQSAKRALDEVVGLIEARACPFSE
jgi:hypothetical protein